MRRIWLLALLTFAVLASMGAAEARIGKQEDIHFIQDVTLKGAKDEALYLGYMTRSYNFLAGLYVEDGGYVLGVKGDSRSFYPMPTGESLARFQAAGTLPNPLPSYKLSIWDYFIGYSFWTLLLPILLLTWLFQRFRKRKEPEAAAPAG